MADYGYEGYEYYDHDEYNDRRDHDDRRAQGAGRPATESFDYGHGRGEEVWDDRRQSPPIARGRGGRNGRHYDEPPPRRGGLLKTPPAPPSDYRRDDDYDVRHHDRDDYNPEFDRGTRRQYSPPPSHPHHSRSRSPLIRQDYDLPPPPPRHDEAYPNYHEEQGRAGPRRSRSRTQERKQEVEVFEYDAGRDYRPPPEDDPTRHHSRDRDRPSRYDANDEPHFQRPLLPVPDSDFRTNNERSFSAERDGNRNRVDERFQDKALLPDPEPEQQEREPYHHGNQRQSRHSFSPERDRNRPRKLENKGQQEYRKPLRDSRPALLPEPELQPQVQHTDKAQKSVQDVLGGFVQPGVQNVQTQMQMEQALFQNQQVLQNFERTQKKDHQKFDEFRREEMKRLGAPPNSSNRTRNFFTGQLDAERKRQIDEEMKQLGVDKRSQLIVRGNIFDTHNIVSGQLDAERRRQIDEELSRLGVGQPAARQDRGNYNLPTLLPTPLSDEQQPSLTAEPTKNKGSFYPSTTQLSDKQQLGLMAKSTKNRGSLYPSTTSHNTSYPKGVQSHSSDYNQDVYSKPALQSNGSGRQTLLPDPNPSGAPRGHGDGLLPTPEGRQPNRKDDGKRPGRPQGDADSPRKRFRDEPKQLGYQEKHQPSSTRSHSSERRQDNRRNQGYSNNSYANKKETPYKGNVDKRPPQPSKTVVDDDDEIEVIDITPPVKKPVPQPEKEEAPMGKGMMQEVNLVAETLAKRDTILEPSKMANSMRITSTKRKDTQPPWKRGIDEKVADTQYQSLLQLGDYAKYLLYDTILDGFQCYICPATFASKKINKDHETGFTHKHNMTTLQKKPGKNEAPSEQRSKVMQRLAAMPTIYGNKGQEGQTSIRAELVGRDDYYFVCRVCHEVFRGPAEHHFTSSSHINLEKKQGKCVECQIYFGSTEKRKNHFTQPLHKKVQSFRMKFKHSQPTQEASKQPTTSTPAATVVQSKPAVTKALTTSMTTSSRNSTTAPPKSEPKKAPVSDRGQPSSDRGGKAAQTTSSKTSPSTSSRKPASNQTPSSQAQQGVSALLKSLRDDEEAKKQDGANAKSRSTGASRTSVAVAKKESVKTTGVKGKEEGQKQVAKQQPVGNFTAKIPTIVKVNPNWKGEVRGLNFTSPVVGFFCKVCAKFYNEKSSTRENHCTTLQHQLNMKVFLMKNAKDKPLPQWMDSLPGSTPHAAAAAGAAKKTVPKGNTKNKQPARKAEMADNIEVVDMEVDGGSTPDSKEDKERTSEWFDGDIEEET